MYRRSSSQELGWDAVMEQHLQLLRHAAAAADGLRLRVVGAIEHIPVLAMAADAIGRADAFCMHCGPPIRLSTAGAERLRCRAER